MIVNRWAKWVSSRITQAPLGPATVALAGLAVVLHRRSEDARCGLFEGRAHLRMQGGLVALDGEHVVGRR